MQCIEGLLALLVKQKNIMLVRTVERVRRTYSCSW